MIKITNIVWDTENNGVVPSQESLGLPSNVCITNEQILDKYEDIADFLSDKYGYCVESYAYEKIDDDENGFISRAICSSPKEDITFRLNPHIDMTKIVDSMQLDSDQTIASLVTKDHIITLEVKGEVRIFYYPEGKDKDYSDIFKYPSEFPEEVMDIIKDGQLFDSDKIEVDMNNWFEVFIHDRSENFITSDVVDCEGYTPMEILSLLLECDKDDEGDT